jgi:hypothetical protein
VPTRVVYLPARHQLDYLAEHVRRSLGKGRSVLLVTANQSARRLWDYFTVVGIDTSRLHIVDVVSSPLLAGARADSTHLLYIGNPMAMETIITRSERMARKMEPPLHVIVHNLNALCLYNSAEVLEEAIRHVMRDVAEAPLLVDLIVEEEGGLYRDLDRFLQMFADYRTALGPRVMPVGDRHATPGEKTRG